MAETADLTELRRGVLASCVLALLAERPRFGLEIVRELSERNGLLTSEGTVYPLLTRLSQNSLVTSLWRHDDGKRPRRYYSVTPAGRQRLAVFRSEWRAFVQSVDTLIGEPDQPNRTRRTSP